jgi:hypothetical protein
MRYVVRVDSSVDVPAFKQAMGHGRLVCQDEIADRGWVEEVKAKNPPLQDAVYFIVDAASEGAIHSAVRDANRDPRWIEGSPIYDVLDSRERRSFPG